MTGKSRARLSRIFATAVLGAGLAATCAAASPGSPNKVTVSTPSEETIQSAAAVSVPSSATDSAPDQTFTFSATDLPPGLSINPASGAITGSTVSDGVYGVTVTATDSSGSQGSAKGNWDVLGKAAITSPGNLVTTAGQLARIPLKVGDTASNAWLYYGVAGGPPGSYVNWNSAATDGWRTATLTGSPAPPEPTRPRSPCSAPTTARPRSHSPGR